MNINANAATLRPQVGQELLPLKAFADRFPVAMRLPLLAAAMIFMAAFISTQIALAFMSRQADRQVETLGRVYLDGLSAAILPYARAGNQPAIQSVLDQAFEFHEGVVDRRLVFLDADRRLIGDATRDDVDVNMPLPQEVGAGNNGALLFADDGSVWAWRHLRDDTEQLGIVAANLEMSIFHHPRENLRKLLILFDLAFSILCAVIGFFIMRRLQRPVAVLSRHLCDAAFAPPLAIDKSEMPGSDRQTLRMFYAFNAMAHAAKERESLLSHVAEQERHAVLGRLAATLAHEIRNPLAGMETAIATLKRYGDRVDTRNEAIAFLERGVNALAQVVTATLANHRARPAWQLLSKQDFEDLRLLVEAESRSKDVALSMALDIPGSLPVAAFEVRQVLLNLLLNAVRASTNGGTVRLDARLDGGDLAVTVADQGSGLDRRTARAMEAQDLTYREPGLGVAVVIQLMKRLRGRISVEAQSGAGTRITLYFPLQEEQAQT